MRRDEKNLLKLYNALDESDRDSLVAFAEFLLQRERGAPEPLPAPVELPRPAIESVVGALKRLSATYPMLDKAKMLNETSVLVAQHVMQGREAVEVIDELEVVFRRHYEILASSDDTP